jgi:hypothetical protein
MGAPRQGVTGILTAVGDLLGINSSGDAERHPVSGTDGSFLQEDSASPLGFKWIAESALGGYGYTYPFGANFPGVAQQGRFHLANGAANASSSNVSPPDPSAAMTIAKSGTLKRIAWNTSTANATTVYTVWKNGAAIISVALTGVQGVITTLSIAVASGDTIAIEYDSGAAPGNSYVNMFIE